jgi:hypothetical protein
MRFFLNSLSMSMPRGGGVRDMQAVTTLTPVRRAPFVCFAAERRVRAQYYNEEVIYSIDDLSKATGAGTSLLFYLQAIYPLEWQNFIERNKLPPVRSLCCAVPAAAIVRPCANGRARADHFV